APVADVWRVVSDPHATRSYLTAITRWDHAGGPRRGVGARFDVRMRVGAVEVGGFIRFTDWREGCVVAWTSESGPAHRGAITLTEHDVSSTRTEIEISYDVPGPAGPVAAFAASFVLRRQLRSALARIASLSGDRPRNG